jgi:hypothetical protein
MPGAIRDPGLNAAKSFALKRLTYPTGGFTDFEYELHDCVEADLPYSRKESPKSITVSNLSTPPRWNGFVICDQRVEDLQSDFVL